MTTALKQRIVGAIFILSLGVILIPVILDKPQEGHEPEMLSRVMPDAPAFPDVSEVSKIHYVFHDTPTYPEPTHPDPNDPNKPEPIEIPPEVVAVAPPSIDSPSIPLPPEMALADMSDEAPIPDNAPVPVDAPAAAPVTKAPVSTTHAKASASLAEASQAQWTIQLGAFSSEQNAKALVQKLSQGGFNPYLRQMTQDSLVRVYISPGIPREQAIDLVSKLDTEYGLKGIVVRYFQQ